ncbi:hypothetical protein C8Q74DRAFT_1039488 [Fomes fomentarius]|nr:hypothetical protein C8Q74DRAFT_1039488 [Fomes fomentarius]
MPNRAKLKWPQCWVCSCKFDSFTKVKEHFEVQHPGVPLVLTSNQLKRARAGQRASTRDTRRLEGLEPEPEGSADAAVSTYIDNSDEAPSSRSTTKSEVQELKREEYTEYNEQAPETNHPRAGSEFSHSTVNASSHSHKRPVSLAAEMSPSKRVATDESAHSYRCRLCSKEQCNDPVVLIPCGHMFCHSCMIEALTVGNGCPQPSCRHHPMYQRLTMT